MPAGLSLEAGPLAPGPGTARGTLVLQYRLRGDLAEILLPAPASPARRDELWRHTCFELFVAEPGGDHYVEFNFSPSTEWAAYGFTGYRQGMQPLPLSMAPQVACHASRQAVDVTVTVARPDLGRAPSAFVQVPHAMALTAVLEFTGGRMSYWSLAHPAGRPDFHHRDGFVATLEL